MKGQTFFGEPWIGVDLDGTLAQYHGWDGKTGSKIGDPVLAMLARVRRWLAVGKRVKIFTARVSHPDKDAACHQIQAVQAWCVEHLGQSLEVTCTKDMAMTELWDDRAVRVSFNEGEVEWYVEQD